MPGRHNQSRKKTKPRHAKRKTLINALSLRWFLATKIFLSWSLARKWLSSLSSEWCDQLWLPEEDSFSSCWCYSLIVPAFWGLVAALATNSRAAPVSAEPLLCNLRLNGLFDRLFGVIGWFCLRGTSLLPIEKLSFQSESVESRLLLFRSVSSSAASWNSSLLPLAEWNSSPPPVFPNYDTS